MNTLYVVHKHLTYEDYRRVRHSRDPNKLSINQPIEGVYGDITNSLKHAHNLRKINEEDVKLIGTIPYEYYSGGYPLSDGNLDVYEDYIQEDPEGSTKNIYVYVVHFTGPIEWSKWATIRAVCKYRKTALTQKRKTIKYYGLNYKKTNINIDISRFCIQDLKRVWF